MVGADAALFIVTPPAGMTLPLTIPAGGTLLVNVAFKTPSTLSGTTTPFPLTIRTASLQIKSNDADQPFIEVSLRGLPTAGIGGQNEPSLQQILDLYQIPIGTGDANPENTNLFSDTEPLAHEPTRSTAQRFIKAGPGDVTIEPLAIFGGATTPARRASAATARARADSKTECSPSTGPTPQTRQPDRRGHDPLRPRRRHDVRLLFHLARSSPTARPTAKTP